MTNRWTDGWMGDRLVSNDPVAIYQLVMHSQRKNQHVFVALKEVEEW